MQNTNVKEKHWVSILVNSMAAKIIAFALVGLLALVVCIGLFTNRHVKMFGIEFNEKVDTISKVVYVKVDSAKPAEVKQTSKQVVLVPNTSKEKKSVTDTVKAKFNVKENTFNAPTIIGDNGTQYNGLKQRHFSAADFSNITKSIPGKQTPIRILIESTSGQEGEVYAEELINKLEQNGYSIIQIATSMTSSPSTENYISYFYEGVLEIKIFPARNVE